MKLPKNYSKKDSKFYVPEQLIEHYEHVKDPSRKEMNVILRDAARHVCRGLSLYFESQAQYDAQLEQIEESLNLDEVLHDYAMNQAAKKYKVAAERQARLQRDTEASTCPICNIVTLGDPMNTVQVRSLNMGKVVMLKSKTDFRSCFDCYLTALSLRTQQAKAAMFGRKTRLELVQQALN